MAAGGVTGGGDAAKADNLNKVRAGVVIALLIGFALFVVFLIDNADAKEATWKNYVYLFTAVEALVFAGAGWFFGREIARPVVEQAKEAGKAKEKAAREEEKGRSLAKAVIAQETSTPQRASKLQGMGASPEAATATDVTSLAAFARTQYPDVG